MTSKCCGPTAPARPLPAARPTGPLHSAKGKANRRPGDMAKKRTREQSAKAVASPKIEDKPLSRKRRRLFLLVPLSLILIVAIAGTSFYVLRQPSSPSPPTVDLSEADPAVVQAVQAARGEVTRSPGSAIAWGRLGLLLAGC